jgi:hypothetical protein
MDDISFRVDGFPPAKSEALSMLGEGHPHAPRVVTLLKAASEAISEQDLQPLGGPIGLQVTLYAPAGVDPWDATNYLGGIADVLQDKGHVRISTAHLGDMVHVALYKNDRQIREIHYRQEEGTTTGYEVRIWSLK